jgi:3-isopropylmalate/(R)-2-methylmalate dehydratase small subunit
MEKLIGKAWCFGDDISTDTILPSKWKTTSFELKDLGRHAMGGIDENFGEKISPGDFIIAGVNFGCGSSREQAPMALKGCGLKVVIAKTFARIFFRNCINIGLYPLEIDWKPGFFNNGDLIEINFSTKQVKNITLQKEIEFKPLPLFLEELFKAGGLKSFLMEGKNLTDLIHSQRTMDQEGTET